MNIYIILRIVKGRRPIKIFHGLVHTVVNKVFKKEKPDFTVETQTAVIGVRGTDYYTLVGPATSDIYNNSGTTEVNNIFAEIPGKVKLKGQEYTQVAANRPPTLPLPLTQDDINWIKGQMTPKVVSKQTGSGAVSGQNQLLSKVGGSSVTPLSVGTVEGIATRQNIVQNLQSAIYVPPQPRPSPTPTSSPLPTPFNIFISWGSGARDLDLYLTGPTTASGGVTSSPSFTVSYLNSGSLTSQPFAFYHVDSQVPNGSEAITINKWNPGDNYLAYVHNYTDRGSTSSTVLSSSSGVNMQLIRGGTVTIIPIGSGSDAGTAAKVTGGTVLQTILPPTDKIGTYWSAVAINPNTGVITPQNIIGNSVPTVPITPATTPTTPAISTGPQVH